MADDNKKNPMQEDPNRTPNQDQQKGGEATATDQDLADLESTDVPTDTTEDTDTDENTQE